MEDWSKICYSDASTFQLQTSTIPKLWNKISSPSPIRPTLKHPTKFMVWSVMSVKGAGRLHVVEGNIKTDQYVHVLTTWLLPQVRDWFPEGNYSFMQDGAPCHTSKKSMEWLRQNRIPVFDWPGNSPDCNSIDTLWAIIKRRIPTQTHTTQQELISAIIKAWMKDASVPETCKRLVARMPDRIRADIRAKDGHMKYLPLRTFFYFLFVCFLFLAAH